MEWTKTGELRRIFVPGHQFISIRQSHLFHHGWRVELGSILWNKTNESSCFKVVKDSGINEGKPEFYATQLTNFQQNIILQGSSWLHNPTKRQKCLTRTWRPSSLEPRQCPWRPPRAPRTSTTTAKLYYSGEGERLLRVPRTPSAFRPPQSRKSPRLATVPSETEVTQTLFYFINTTSDDYMALWSKNLNFSLQFLSNAMVHKIRALIGHLFSFC